jgi:pyruvate dehydrogenase E2 component (dihydrolipoamide acetyltransferase)
VELPCPFEGEVDELLVEAGATVEVGTPIISVRVSGESPMPVADKPDAQPAVAQEADTGAEYKIPTLVGYGDAGEAKSRRGRPVKPAATATAVPVAMVSAAALASDSIIAKPPIRKMAKELGVNLATVNGSGTRGEITREDVISSASQASVFKNLTTPAVSSEREERIPVKGMRKVIATAMVKSAFTAPHVSIFVDVDATRTMEYVKRLKASVDFAGVKVTPLLIMAKAIIWAARRNRMVNSTWSDTEIIVHYFVNLGIAAATPRGLIVPNIKDADAMNMIELATAIEKLAATAREGKTTPEDMKDGTITITNIGVFGVDTGTPILNPGEVGIVALGSIRKKPWVVDDEIVVRQVTTIGATFDHRVVDGDVASRFVQDVASVIEEPALLLD